MALMHRPMSAGVVVAWTLISAGALLLWIGYFNFAMQMAGWPLLALGLALGVAAVEQLASSPKDQRRLSNDLTPEPSSLVLRLSSDRSA